MDYGFSGSSASLFACCDTKIASYLLFGKYERCRATSPLEIYA